MQSISAIGPGTAKSVFQLHGVDAVSQYSPSDANPSDIRLPHLSRVERTSFQVAARHLNELLRLRLGVRYAFCSTA